MVVIRNQQGSKKENVLTRETSAKTCCGSESEQGWQGERTQRGLRGGAEPAGAVSQTARRIEGTDQDEDFSWIPNVIFLGVVPWLAEGQPQVLHSFSGRENGLESAIKLVAKGVRGGGRRTQRLSALVVMILGNHGHNDDARLVDWERRCRRSF